MGSDWLTEVTRRSTYALTRVYVIVPKDITTSSVIHDFGKSFTFCFYFCLVKIIWVFFYSLLCTSNIAALHYMPLLLDVVIIMLQLNDELPRNGKQGENEIAWKKNRARFARGFVLRYCTVSSIACLSSALCYRLKVLLLILDF